MTTFLATKESLESSGHFPKTIRKPNEGLKYFCHGFEEPSATWESCIVPILHWEKKSLSFNYFFCVITAMHKAQVLIEAFSCFRLIFE